MPGRCIVEDAGRTDRARRSRRSRSRSPRPAEEAVEPRRAAPRDLGMLGERGERRPQLPHRGGGGEAVADDVADGQADAPVGELERVVPVAADLEHVAAGFVARRDREPRAASTSWPGSSARCSSIAISRSSASCARSASSARVRSCDRPCRRRPIPRRCRRPGASGVARATTWRCSPERRVPEAAGRPGRACRASSPPTLSARTRARSSGCTASSHAAPEVLLPTLSA